MTNFLASVSNLQEAGTILAVGADIIDIKNPLKGALGAVDHEITKEIVQRVSGRVLTSATIGDLPMKVGRISSAIDDTRATGVDIIKVGIFEHSVSTEILHALKKITDKDCRIVLVFFADLYSQLENFSELADAGIFGVMLDTADKTNGSLRTIIKDNVLENFVRLAQSAGLLTGLAGSLKLADIQPLLKLKPDFLGFRSALCDKQMRNNMIEIQAAHNIRAMIPAHAYGECRDQKLILSVN